MIEAEEVASQEATPIVVGAGAGKVVGDVVDDRGVQAIAVTDVQVKRDQGQSQIVESGVDPDPVVEERVAAEVEAGTVEGMNEQVEGEAGALGDSMFEHRKDSYMYM